MLTFKSWAVSAVTAAAIVGVISLFTPSGSMEKTLKTVIGLFLLASFILPLSDSDITGSLFKSNEGIKEIIDENEYENEIKNNVSDSLESTIKTEICAYLSNAGVAFTDVEAHVSVDDKNNIETQSIVIVLREDVQIEDIIDFISERFGVVPEVKIEAED